MYKRQTLELVHEAFPQFGLSTAAPAPLSQEDVVESIKAQISAHESDIANLQAKVKSLKEQIKPAKVAAQG